MTKHNFRFNGKRLRRFRDKKGLTQMKLALAVNLGPAAISNFETGRENNPTSETLADLSVALGVTPNDLLGFKCKH